MREKCEINRLDAYNCCKKKRKGMKRGMKRRKMEEEGKEECRKEGNRWRVYKRRE